MNIEKVFISKDTAETEFIGCEFAETLSSGCIIAFVGGLGMGKTAFIRGMSKAISPESLVVSPTFTIINEYRGNKLNICHMDAYRLNSGDELFDTGFYDYAENGWICCVEWSENVKNAFVPDYVIEIKRIDDNTREIIIREEKA